ncbi:DNA-binding transcriptional regulator, LysR family [Propionispira arboris]|uniref:DNA-binding transcriptional regulator, LysR family n=1 Tax=Propionispira arboris TaxID=84035 RepID=A0A1H6X0S8_9FIRM|nr:LysR family transcriptional regulator [Propionispira arboris]SEJ21154.1 DNA-binding transcriptional regulator, LysR family [Propionispira arboris]
MTLQQLRYIIEVVNSGSINEASKQLFITQPSLSSAIKELETELNIMIFTRTTRGIHLTSEGAEFLSYARQIIEQTQLLEQRYLNAKPSPQIFSVSTQHYAFAVNAFVQLIRQYGHDEYRFKLRETRTYEIIEDVHNLKSELGVLYLNDFNKKIIEKLLKENDLSFHPLFEASPHIFVSSTHPLTKKKKASLHDLDEYPCLTFEQGDYNSFYFSEEILSTLSHKKNIEVSDRATLFNLLIGLNGYTISTGIVSADLNGDNIVPIPLDVDETICVGWITNTKGLPGKLGQIYIQALKEIVSCYASQNIRLLID